MYKRFLAYYLMFLMPFVLMLGGNYVYLLHASEYLDIDQLVQKHLQPDRFCLWDTAVSGRGFEYKLKAAQVTQPKVLVLGSSRTVQFRQKFFRVPFYNAGNASSTLPQAELFLKSLFSVHKPEVVLIGLDTWWFHEGSEPDHFSPAGGKSIVLKSIFLPFEWIEKGKISIPEYVQTVLTNPYQTHHCRLGVAARTLQSGYGPDGSYYYTDLIIGNDPKADREFTNTLQRIENSSPYFRFGTQASGVQFVRLQALVDFITSNGAEAVLFFNPFAPQVFDAMEAKGEQYAYIDDAKAQLSARGLKYFDFRDPATIGSSECEFIDGFHGGDVTAARILNALHDASPKLKSFIDLQAVNQYIERFAGLAMGIDDRVITLPEVDFLNLGCKK